MLSKPTTLDFNCLRSKLLLRPAAATTLRRKRSTPQHTQPARAAQYLITSTHVPSYLHVPTARYCSSALPCTWRRNVSYRTPPASCTARFVSPPSTIHTPTPTSPSEHTIIQSTHLACHFVFAPSLHGRAGLEWSCLTVRSISDCGAAPCPDHPTRPPSSSHLPSQPHPANPVSSWPQHRPRRLQHWI